MITYEIKYEPVLVEGKEFPKYNIYYSDGSKQFHSTDGKSTGNEIGQNINAPNWLGVEQSLRYSSAFSRRKEVDPNDFSIFLATLINGKAGDASEAALAYAFGILGIVWTEPEMALINKILKDNNFTIQLK